MPIKDEKPVQWLGSSREDIKAMPRQVRQKFGFALRDAQEGKKHRKAKPLTGFGGANVLEIVEDFDTNTYRAVYTVRFVEAVYVLHVFQKKIPQRYRYAACRCECDWGAAASGGRDTPGVSDKTAAGGVIMGMNVYADLGFENPEMELAKARVVSVLRDLMVEKGLSDAENGQRLGITAEEVDNILDGHWDDYSVDRLIGYVHILDASIRFDPDTGRAVGEAAAPLTLTA